ncbi:MAG: hypothetical protein HQ507_09690 [Candidatus Marinimicrobia bacterium]|nr:hypothetical protein [Candidatus Neomarinimicrobiota bacterium]
MKLFGRFTFEQISNFLRRPLEVVVLRYLLMFMILSPTAMYLVWLVSPKQQLNIVLVDKSVPEENRIEHAAINWVFTHERIVNERNEFYQKKLDYYGFFPRPGGDYVVKDFSPFDSLHLDSLAAVSDLLYLADTYGVFAHNYGVEQSKPNHLLYGGLNWSDLALIQAMRAKDKLIIGEFSLFAAPTSRSVRDSLEAILGLEWQGWVGRYFISLDSTANEALPGWVVKLYQEEHGPVWPFRDSGVILVKGSEIVILEYGTHLNLEVPFIETQTVYAAQYDLPGSVNYPFWFDIVTSPHAENQIVSIFHLPVNERGDSLLALHRIPKIFPAVLRAGPGEHPFYYFAGDFSDNPVPEFAAYLKGVSWFQSFFYHRNQRDDRSQFFWTYYRPLLRSILETEIQRTKR